MKTKLEGGGKASVVGPLVEELFLRLSLVNMDYALTEVVPLVL